MNGRTNDAGAWLSDDGPWWLSAFAWTSPDPKAWEPDHWWRYANGFKEAGDRILSSILNDERRDGLDLLLVPTLFIYRHYIEVAIKAADRAIALLLGEESTAGKDRNHTLQDGWRQVFERAKRLPGDATPFFPEADRFIDELHHHDPKSFAFRYPESQKGERHAPDLHRVNYVRLAEGIGHVHDAIGWLEGSIDYAQECRPY